MKYWYSTQMEDGSLRMLCSTATWKTSPYLQLSSPNMTQIHEKDDLEAKQSKYDKFLPSMYDIQ